MIARLGCSWLSLRKAIRFSLVWLVLVTWLSKKKLNKKKHNLYCLSLKREELLHINQLSLFSPSTDGSTGDLTGDSAEILFQSFLQEGVVNSSGMSEMSILNWCCPSSVSSSDHGVAHSPSVP